MMMFYINCDIKLTLVVFYNLYIHLYDFGQDFGLLSANIRRFQFFGWHNLQIRLVSGRLCSAICKLAGQPAN